MKYRAKWNDKEAAHRIPSQSAAYLHNAHGIRTRHVMHRRIINHKGR